ncbi:MAG: TetR/AcrR family transcriptional regulator [Leptolyngbya sp. SIO4C1]|nr:TetR/AcrR family transcriptional regulator [Leptolyngbya sp. SIO4C1]
MPTPTFFNLPERKRQMITELAIAEFATADYDSASISNIVKQAKIAKGSFYQYFQDKRDLYLYLIDLASERQMAFIQTTHPEPPGNFFETLRWLFRTSVQFNLQHPELSQIINRAAYGSSSLRMEALERSQTPARQYIHQLVEKGLAAGDLQPDLDPDLATFIIVTAGDNLRYYIPEKLGLSTTKLAAGTETNIDLQAVEQIFDDLIQVFRHGIGH